MGSQKDSDPSSMHDMFYVKQLWDDDETYQHVCHIYYIYIKAYLCNLTTIQELTVACMQTAGWYQNTGSQMCESSRR